MRILLDECLPKRLKRDLVGHPARTVPEMGWASKKNGELLALAGLYCGTDARGGNSVCGRELERPLCLTYVPADGVGRDLAF